MTTNPRDIIREVGEWAQRQPWANPPRNAPDIGIIEEVGELHHAILKNYQGIRGLDDPAKFHDKLVDALGDCMVYLSHWCYLTGTYYNVPSVTPPRFATVRVATQHLMIVLSQFMSCYEGDFLSPAPHEDKGKLVYNASNLATALAIMANMFELDLVYDCLAPTWHKVKQRDWEKNKMTGEAPVSRSETRWNGGEV